MSSWRVTWALAASAAFLILTPGADRHLRAVSPADTTPTSQTPRASRPAPKVPSIPPEAANPKTGWTEEQIRVPVVGHAYVYAPRHPTTSDVVLFLSGDGGWNLGVIDMARRIMPQAIVIGISYVALRRAPGPSTLCWMPSGDIEVVAHDAEKQLKLPAYEPPVLVGYSSGATEVYEALAASPYSFASGLALGFCPDLPASHSLCASDDFKPPPRDVKHNVVMLPTVPALVRDFYVVNGVEDQVCDVTKTRAFLAGIKNAHFYEVPSTGHGFSKPWRWGPEFDEALGKTLESGEAANHPTHAAPVVAPAGTAAALEGQLEALKLPLEYVWADRTRAILVFLSGDGGWMSIDRSVSGFLSRNGVSVIGLNSQSYFWDERSPEQGGIDLARIVDIADTLRVPVFVGGYSIGAETTPFMVNSWPVQDRKTKISGEVLIAPSKTATFEFKIVNMIFRAKPTPFVVATAVKESEVPTLCVSGRAEAPADTACTDVGTAAEAVTLPGSHHFDSKYDDVGRVALTFIDKHVDASAQRRSTFR